MLHLSLFRMMMFKLPVCVSMVTSYGEANTAVEFTMYSIHITSKKKL